MGYQLPDVHLKGDCHGGPAAHRFHLSPQLASWGPWMLDANAERREELAGLVFVTCMPRACRALAHVERLFLLESKLTSSQKTTFQVFYFQVDFS